MERLISTALVFTAVFVLISCGEDSSNLSLKCTDIDAYKCTKDNHSKYCDSNGTWVEIEYCEYGCNISTGKCFPSSGNGSGNSGSDDYSGNDDYSGDDSSTCSGASFRCKNENLSQRCWEGSWANFEECTNGKKCDPASGKCAAPKSDDEQDYENTNCATNNEGKSCDTDDSCGECMICVNGICTKGCEDDADCYDFAGTLCNKRLARCLNPLASGQVCFETNCKSGCCYAEKGLSALRCLTIPTPAICGQCKQGEIYSPEDNACIPSACSPTTDNCPSINSGSTTPASKCFGCNKSTLLCEAQSSTSGCMEGQIINMKECIPSGKRCNENQTCCSGFACIEGFCY